MRFDIEPGSPLDVALGRLYQVFERYPVAGHDFGSPLKEPIPPDVLHADIRSIPDETISLIARRAITTLGDDVLLRHFLPRILQVLAEDLSGLDAWWALERLELAHWETWPAEERKAINEFIEARVFAWMGRDEDLWTVKVLLDDLDRGGFDLQPLIDVVAARLLAAWPDDWSVREWLNSELFGSGSSVSAGERALESQVSRPEVAAILSDHLAAQNWRVVEIECPRGHVNWQIACDGPSWDPWGNAPGPIAERDHYCESCGQWAAGNTIRSMSPPLFYFRRHPAHEMTPSEVDWWVTVLECEFADVQMARDWVAGARAIA